jgi:hypothetical protein
MKAEQMRVHVRVAGFATRISVFRSSNYFVRNL